MAQTLLREAGRQLHDAGIDTARLDAEVLLAHAFGVERLALLSDTEVTLNARQAQRFQDFIDRRRAREPVAYIVGYAEFWSHDFCVQPGILIPRADSEILVEAALKAIPHDRPLHFADLGVGSGCLALSILAERVNATAVGVDVSDIAIATAKQNAQRLNVSDRFETRHEPMDQWLQNVSGYALIVSNPPYIDQKAYDALEKDVKAFEPKGALIGGVDGLDYYHQLATLSPNALAPGGRVITEIGFDQKDAVIALFQANFQNLKCIQDLAGRDRVIIAS